MSKPSAWNGRNQSILGATGTNAAATDADALNSQPTSNVDDSKSNPSEDKGPTKSNGAAAPAPSRSVWNGRHDKLKELSEETDASTENTAPSNGSGSIHVSSKKERLVSNNIRVSIKDDIKSNSHQGKEDESTNSTAGSSTTNMGEDPSEDVPMTASSDDMKKDQYSSTINATTGTTSSAGEANNIDTGALLSSSTSSRRSQEAIGAGARRGATAAGNNKGGRPTGNAAGNSNGQQRYNRSGSGTSGAATGRRRVPYGEKAICSFFMRGMCTRGTACWFRHDPAYSPQSDQANPNSMPPMHGNINHAMKGMGVSSSIPNRFGSARVYDPLKARAIALAKEAQDREDRTKFVSPQDDTQAEPAFFSIDVECISTGYGSCARGINDGCGNEGRTGEDVPSSQYNDRSHRYPGRVAMVDTDGNVVADILIRPPQDGKGVISYLTPLTGLTEELCLGPDAKSLEEAVKVIKDLLPKDAVLVGQSIDHDVEWLGLTPGKDFSYMADITEIFRQRTPKMLNEASDALKKMEESGDTRHAVAGAAGEQPVEKEADADTSAVPTDTSSDEYLGFVTKYRCFSLRHVCLNLLSEDIQSGIHNPITDAKYSLALFHKYRNSSVTQLRIVRDALHRAPITPGFAAENPVVDGVCVSAAGYPFKRAARSIWRWYSGKKSAQ